LPESGPTHGAVVSAAQYETARLSPSQDLQYALVNLNIQTIASMPRDTGNSLDFPPTNARPASGLIGVGDLIGITIFESGSGGLFLPREPGTRSGNFVALPTQQVDLQGNITVPYGGTIRAAGHSPAEIQKEIQDRLAARALEPQVVVSLIDRRAKAVTVLGEVTGATHFALDPGGERLLGAIARAGGPKYPSYETVVTIQRNGQAKRVLLADIAANPRENIQMEAGDSVYLSHEPRYFVALGATGLSGGIGLIDRRIPFSDYKINLADAMAKAGGLQDGLAHVKGVFVYRQEPRETVMSYGLNPQGTPLPPRVPTIYALDLSQPAGFFHAQSFAMRNEDVVYVSNAPATDITKFLSIIGSATGSTAAVRATVNP
jgi:polysaccharide export outer membrane protein